MFKNIFNLISIFVILILFLFSQNVFSQQASEYVFTQTAGTYTPITGGTVLWSGTFDDQITDSIAMPSFTFNGVAYTMITVSANGYATLGTASLSYTPISSTAASPGVFSVFGRDLNYATSGTPEVRYETVGNEFVVQWQDVRRYNVAGEIFSLQLRLNSSDNSIKFVYGGTITPGSNTSYPQIGLRGAANSDFNNRTITSGGGNWINSAAGATNTATMYFNSANPTTVPTSGLTYTFTVPAILNPSGVTATTISSSQIDVAFTPYAGNNVIIVFNNSGLFTDPTGTPPAPGQPFAGGTLIYNGLVSPYNHLSLTPATTYYYRLFTYGGGTIYSAGVSVSATTSCEPISVFPWTEGFETLTIPALPNCWLKDPSSSGWATTNNANSTNDADARTGTQFLREPWLATNEHIWTPGFQLTAGVSYDFSFWWAGDNYSGWTGDVFYNTLQSSVGATQIGTSFVTNGDTTTKNYQKEIYQFTPTVAGTYYFAIRVNCPTSTPWYLSFDDFSFQTTPTTPVFSISPASKNFGSIYVGSSSANQTFTLTNVGIGTITITAGNISIVGTDAGQFVLTDANTYPINLGAGQSAVVDVKFSPTTLGAKTADLQIIDNTTDATHTAALTGTGATPPAVPDFEDFETFVVGQQVACQDPINWTTWSNSPCNATEDAFISSTFAFSGTKSAKVVQNNDLVRLLNAQTSGKWHISFMSYIPTGKAGYFNTLALFVPVSGSIWGMECYFDVGGGGRVKAGSSAFTAFTWVPDSWKKVEVFVDLDVDSAKFLYDGALVISWKWTLGTGTTTPLQLDASDFFGATVNDEMYIDDYQIQLVSSNTFQLSVNVANGWNMVSIPGLHPTDQNVNTWWAFRDPGANVFRYAGGYQPVTVAAPGIGYWMKHAGALTYNTGEEWPSGGIQTVAHDPLAGASGWNLIGGYELSVTAANVTTNPPGLQSGPIYAYSGGYQVATTLTPGLGYWIKLNAAGQIIIPESMAKGEVVEYFPEEWGRIILTDATGTSYTLYSVTGKVELSQYELPPAPPTGMFDIRFNSGRIAEDINSSVKTIDMSGVTYPLTVRVEGMDIRLMDETGKAINVNLKAGEDVVISDATVMKLMVSGELIPAQYSLEQNYPNPFNPSTVIEFSLPEDVSNVKLSIYNALGEKVAELVNTSLTAGKYQYQWNAQNVATGMYIYELRTDNFVSVKKMVLLK